MVINMVDQAITKLLDAYKAVRPTYKNPSDPMDEPTPITVSSVVDTLSKLDNRLLDSPFVLVP